MRFGPTWLKTMRRSDKRRPELPLGLRIYAIGDIHGCLDQLNQLLELIEKDCESHRGTSLLIFLGDYVDRGPDSAGVLRRLLTQPLPISQQRFLAGNHDRVMLECWETGRRLRWWLTYGGAETLASYGIARSELKSKEEELLAKMHEAIPRRDITFLQRLQSSLRLGDYFFAHAGIRPGVPLDQQSDEDLLWIRDPFLQTDRHHEAVIVHGHTIVEAPLIQPNRIAVDTGCFRTGRLTTLVLEGPERRFLQTA